MGNQYREEVVRPDASPGASGGALSKTIAAGTHGRPEPTGERPRGRFRFPDIVALAALFVSGGAALIYEICWIRKASLVFGSTTFAMSTVIAVFFLGLAFGSYLFGRHSHRLIRPLYVFGGLEVALGLFALATPLIFQVADSIYGTIYRNGPERQWVLGIARAGLVALVLLPATTVMGATIPLFCRRYANSSLPISRSVGFLYGLNTLGAAAGAAAAGFVLLPWLGLGRTIQVGAGLSVLFGLIIVLLPASRSRLDNPSRAGSEGPSPSAASDKTARLSVLVLYFAVGFAALSLQVVWFRFLSLVIRNTVTTYTLVITVVLAGIVLGSWLAALLISRKARCARLFGTLQVLSALAVIGLMSLPAATWRSLESELWVCALLMLIPSVLGGASFPLAVRLLVSDTPEAALGAGFAAASNTLGGVLGALTAGFLLIPYLGIQYTIWIVTLAAFLAGLLAWLWLDRTPLVKRPSGTAGMAGACVLWIAIATWGPARLPADFLVEGDDELLDYREGFGANIAAVRHGEAVHLEIDRWWQGEDRKNHQAAAAHIPSLLHPGPSSVLLVGVGTGQTASRFLMHGIDRLDCVDIEPVIFDFVRRHFDSTWMDDPRSRLIAEDGRTYLRHGPERYDIISLELGQVFRPGIAYFYTREAYEFARQRLNPDGMVVQFVPLPFFTREEFASVVGTFLDVFPQSVLWYNTSEVLLIGANAEAFPWNPDLDPEPSWSAAVRDDLDLYYWGGPDHRINRPEVFLGGFLTGSEGLERIAGSQRRLRDDLPLLDYSTARMHPLQGNEIRIAEDLRRNASSLVNALDGDWAPAYRNRVTQIQQRNLGDIAASALLRQSVALSERGQYSRAQSLLLEALEWNPDFLEANIRLGEQFHQTGQAARALGYFRIAAEIHPGDARAQRGIAISLHRTGRPGDAIPYYARAIEIDPDDAESHNNLGAAHAEGGDLEAAVEHFAEAVRLRPGYAEAERNLQMARRVLDVFEGE